MIATETCSTSLVRKHIYALSLAITSTAANRASCPVSYILGLAPSMHPPMLPASLAFCYHLSATRKVNLSSSDSKMSRSSPFSIRLILIMSSLTANLAAPLNSEARNRSTGGGRPLSSRHQLGCAVYRSIHAVLIVFCSEWCESFVRYSMT